MIASLNAPGRMRFLELAMRSLVGYCAGTTCAIGIVYMLSIYNHHVGGLEILNGGASFWLRWFAYSQMSKGMFAVVWGVSVVIWTLVAFGLRGRPSTSQSQGNSNTTGSLSRVALILTICWAVGATLIVVHMLKDGVHVELPLPPRPQPSPERYRLESRRHHLPVRSGGYLTLGFRPPDEGRPHDACVDCRWLITNVRRRPGCWRGLESVQASL